MVSTAHGLKFTDFKVRYHQRALEGIDTARANEEIILPARYESVRDTVLGEIERRFCRRSLQDGRRDSAMSMDRNLALELVRTTEAASLACARLMGRGDETAADQAAVDAMRAALNRIEMDATVVIGEGERDEAPMLYIGEQVGTRHRSQDRDRARSARGHHDLRDRRPQCTVGDRSRRGGRLPARARHLHGQDRRGSGGCGLDRHRPHLRPRTWARSPRPRRCPRSTI